MALVQGHRNTLEIYFLIDTISRLVERVPDETYVFFRHVN